MNAAAGHLPAAQRRIVIAGGGTGGHLFPGIAVAGEFMRRNVQNRVLFVSAGNPFEQAALARAGFSLRGICVEGIKGRGIARKARALLRVPIGIGQSAWILGTFRPHLVIGMGSYAAGPVILAARLLGLPVVLHEQNLLPGMTNRFLARFARRIYVSFESTVNRFEPAKVRVTGNPVRREIIDTDRSAPEPGATADAGVEPLRVLVAGGSQGAHAVNMAVVDMLALLEDKDACVFVHQTGTADAAVAADAYRRHGVRATVQPFFDDMDRRYREADLLICRAGATTVAEITAVGKAALFIPFPQAADNHQVLNARELEREGAAEVIEQKELTPERLAERIGHYAAHRRQLQQMGLNAARLGRPDAAAAIVDDCYALMSGER
jgi:UDP-N-acetylglucosamine--N-acetylmuramyl-(pentapeptide) pyrophosphoryl-undecaprenol N-acetylglucosamine transferase